MALQIVYPSAARTATPTPVDIVTSYARGLHLSANDVLPDFIRVSMTHGDADSITYSVAAYLLD